MSFTRFHDDPARIIKKNIEASSMNDYVFNVPGNTMGIQSHYYEDPQLRLQKLGGQQFNNMVHVESMLRNSHVKLNRDNVKLNNYKKNTVNLSPIKSKIIEQANLISIDTLMGTLDMEFIDFGDDYDIVNQKSKNI